MQIFYIKAQDKSHGMIVPEYLNESLICSALGAFAFYLGVYSSVKRSARLNLGGFFKNVRFTYSMNLVFLQLLILFSFSIMLYSYIEAFSQVGVGDRIYFLDVVRPIWYVYLVPLNALVVAAIIMDSRMFNYKILTLIMWVLIFLHIGIVGFDGSRRYALPPIMIVFFRLVFLINNTGNIPRYGSFISLFCLLLLSQLLTLSRAFDVGWGILSVDFQMALQYLPVFIEMSLSAMPTVHVNTMMLELNELEGIHGFSSYLRAIGNTLFPQFIFGFYMFGEPLVLELHNRFGWYGQDFGFMAEAIYSGGRFGVFIVHFLLGIMLGWIANRVTKRRLRFLFTLLLLTFLLAMINSLRSDFMNLLKIFLYPGLFIYFISRVLALKPMNNDLR